MRVIETRSPSVRWPMLIEDNFLSELEVFGMVVEDVDAMSVWLCRILC